MVDQRGQRFKANAACGVEKDIGWQVRLVVDVKAGTKEGKMETVLVVPHLIGVVCQSFIEVFE